MNHLQPGPMEADLISEFIARLVDHVPLGRIAPPQEITAPAAYLACDVSGYMTASSITTDSGFAV